MLDKQTITLQCDEENNELHNKSYLWQLLHLATEGIIEAFHSDLYHDALYVQKMSPQPTLFFYGVGKCGTSIYQDKTTALECRQHGRETIYKCELTYHPFIRSNRQFTVERITDHA